ncbi:MAG: asparagine synthase (glutamine-hydrolyzing) [Flavobacteriales bacterium]|nr:MAG: asparagine synthase (glutamine-hydrolyzing) [Flavobacteriales bacterium]
MCGIAGDFTYAGSDPNSAERVRAALTCLAHRGPDDEGVYQEGSCVLGQRRLSIIDTSSAGHQPFTDNGGPASAGKRYTITFNGEVFNYKELRAGLEAQGHSFRSHSDTEVALRLYTQKGPAFLHDLNGFFALAIHDKETDELFIARDRYGVKPLLYTEHEGHFLFASELRALMAMGIPRNVDGTSVHQYFDLQFIPAPDSALLGVHKLMPGERATVNAHGLRKERWYDLQKAARAPGPRKDIKSDLFSLLDEAVKLRLIADVPVGTFLSGGLDSSIVSALAKRHHRDLRTFSIGFPEEHYFDETEHAERTAAHIGSEHTTFKLTRDDLAEAYPRLLANIDEPFADSSALPSFILCERTKQNVTVALSGDGADEVFGGYRKHQAELRMRAPGMVERVVHMLGPLWSAVPRSRNNLVSDTARKLHRFAELAGHTAAERWWRLAAQGAEAREQHLLALPMDERAFAARKQALTGALTGAGDMNDFLLADLQSVLPDNMLHKVDLTSMAHALEVRTPFLDRRVVELAFSRPASMKFSRGRGKQLLRDTFGHLLPLSTNTRRKQGFDVPLRDLFLGPLTGLVAELTAPDLLRSAGMDPSKAHALKGRLASTDPGESQATVHALLVYVSWWKRWMV